MDHVARKTGAAAAATFALLAWSSSAHAHQGYPKIIDTTLNLTGSAALETAYPAMGCQVCHNSASGGDALRAFGSLMVENYGLSPSTAEQDASLEAALALLEQEDPQAVRDLKGGMNPNDDPVVFQNALPTPEHGCTLGAARPAVGRHGVLPAALLALLGMAAARRRPAVRP